MGIANPPHLSPNFHFNLQTKMPKRKSKSEIRLLNTLQEELFPRHLCTVEHPIRRLLPASQLSLRSHSAHGCRVQRVVPGVPAHRRRRGRRWQGV